VGTPHCYGRAMTIAEYDPEGGVLRLDHAALSVLATLAVRPTDPALHDHAVAPVVDVLRRTGLLGRRGVPGDVAAMVSVVGRAERAYRLVAHDHGHIRAARVWAGGDLAVVGVEDGEGAYALMADRLAAGADLLTELVGLAPAPEPAVTGTGTVRADALLELLAAPSAPVDLTAAVVHAPNEHWVPQLRRVALAAPVHWVLWESAGPAPGPVLVVVDGGGEGLWCGAPAPAADASPPPCLQLGPTTPHEVRHRLAVLLGAANG
jgi:hypothetical protein